MLCSSKNADRSSIRLFYSYSHRDERFREELEKHLSLLKRTGIISAWHDRKIAAGEDWAGKIDENPENSQLILLLISPDFIASRYCFDVEAKRALELHETGAAVVIPIILRPVDWQEAPFGKLRALPKDGKPVVKWKLRDAAFHDITNSIV